MGGRGAAAAVKGGRRIKGQRTAGRAALRRPRLLFSGPAPAAWTGRRRAVEKTAIRNSRRKTSRLYCSSGTVRDGHSGLILLEVQRALRLHQQRLASENKGGGAGAGRVSRVSVRHGVRHSHLAAAVCLPACCSHRLLPRAAVKQDSSREEAPPCLQVLAVDALALHQQVGRRVQHLLGSAGEARWERGQQAGSVGR